MGYCYFGSYDPHYSRNRVIIKGLILNGKEVHQCNSKAKLIRRQLKLVTEFLKIRKKVSVIIVGFPGHYDLPLAVLLGKLFKKKVVYDVFAAKYETYVLDKKIISKLSPSAWFFWVWDKFCLMITDYILIDTKQHRKLYKSIYLLKKEKLVLVHVGTDDEIFYPSNSREINDVLFYGSYQPLQGTEQIIKAAKLLPKVNFKMIGNGQTREETEKLSKRLKLKNVKFVDWVTSKKLAEEINNSKIVLGVFGESVKAQAVIPNKVYDGLACQKAVITGDTEAVREVLTSERNCILISPTYEDLKSQIERLLKNNSLRNRIAKAGFNLYSKELVPKVVVKKLLKL